MYGVAYSSKSMGATGISPRCRTVTVSITLSPRRTVRSDRLLCTSSVREARHTPSRLLSTASTISSAAVKNTGLPVEKAQSSSARAITPGSVRCIFIA